ncbi:MAG: alanine--tRNA ligase [Patescibacteria group bacterium]|jgi:alanyl-tRNA synthetase
MKANELKKKYLKFFAEKGHAIIPSASLIPENDPTVLFTNAGMHPLVPYLLGEKHPAGKRLVDVQKCIRTGDIDEVGDDVHLTFFEMLGNWSLGDYWKKEAIQWSFEFLTKELNIPLEKLAVSCFAGDSDAPKDEESAAIWQKMGIPKNRIYFFGKNDNWWGPAGQTGPCGPDTEMFYWTGKGNPPDLLTGDNKSGWVEIWNDVFMQYNKTAAGKYEELKQKNVDTGMGVERTLAVLNGQNNVFTTELFAPIIKEIKKLAKTENEPASTPNRGEKSIRIIADHLRSATFILGDEKGIVPSNLDQGYVLRRLIRRAIRHGKMIGIDKPFTFAIAKIVVKEYSADYPELKKNKDFIEEQLVREEEKFSQTLENGLKQFEKMSEDGISGQEAFILFSTYGFPFEITKELAAEKGIEIDEAGFNEEFKKHQELSRTATEGRFKGGLADNSEITAKMHTATHLMLAALRQILGDHVFQKGSNITPERIRFDFSHSEKMTPEQIKQVEDIVNEQIKKNLPVVCEELSLEQAKAKGAMGVFENKYGDKVKVYSAGEFSKEICGGPHAKTTGELGHFKILKEESSSAGVRRIKAILE